MCVGVCVHEEGGGNVREKLRGGKRKSWLHTATKWRGRVQALMWQKNFLNQDDFVSMPTVDTLQSKKKYILKFQKINKTEIENIY